MNYLFLTSFAMKNPSHPSAISGESVSIPSGASSPSGSVNACAEKPGLALRNFSTTPEFSRGSSVQVEYTSVQPTRKALAEALSIAS